MKFYILTHTNISKKSGLLTALATATALSLAPANAENAQENTNMTKEAQKLICKTKLACEKLSISIQAQIEEIENSDDPDFDKLDKLQNQHIAALKAETKNNDEYIQAKLKEQDKKIDELRGTLYK